MKICSLTINNFLTIVSGTVYLDGRGLNVIQGVNEDDTSATSNGAGKSSIVDALCWVLFGVTARGVKGDKVVNLKAKKDTRVSVRLENGATSYQVTRHRKHKEFKNQLIIEAVSVPASGPAVRLDKATELDSQVELEKILGCSYEVFKAAVYFAQEEMPDLPKMTDRDLKRLVEEAAGLQRIERAYQIARERLNTAEKAWGAIGVKLSTLNTQLERQQEDLKAAHIKHIDWEGNRAVRIKEAEFKVENATTNLTAAQEKLGTLATSLPAVKAKIAELTEVIAEHSKKADHARALMNAAAAADKKIDRAALATRAHVIKEIEKKIAEAPEHMMLPCVECGKPHTLDELEDYLAIQRVHLQDARDAANEVASQVREQAAIAAKAKKDADEAMAALPDVSAVNDHLTKLREFVTQHDRQLNEVNRLSRDLTECKAGLARAETEANPYKATVVVLQDGLTRISAELIATREKNDEHAAKVELAKHVVKVFGPAGVRAQILDTVTPYLNARTADYLSALSDGNISAVWTTLTKTAGGDLKEKFSIEVKSRGGADDFAGLSGGEKRKPRLACALALQDLVASRATQPIDLWIGDEIDDALDPAGLERLMMILERKARERGTVLVISHNSLSDWCDQQTIVRKTAAHTSHIEGALTE